MNIYELVREEAAKEDVVNLSDEEIEHVIWNETSYPCFGTDPDENLTIEANLRTQVRDWAQTVPENSPRRNKNELV